MILIFTSEVLKKGLSILRNIENYVILALLPNYIEQENSSLIFMIDRLSKNKRKESGFYPDDSNDLRNN